MNESFSKTVDKNDPYSEFKGIGGVRHFFFTKNNI